MKRRSLASRGDAPPDRRHDLRGAARPSASTRRPRASRRASEMALGLPYLRGLEAAGGLPVVMPPLGEDAIEPLLDRLDGICLSGGPDLDPGAYGAEPHPELGPTEPDLDRFELARRRARRRPRDADPGDLPRHPGAQRRPRRRAAPAPARALDRDRPPPAHRRRPDQPPRSRSSPAAARRRARRRRASRSSTSTPSTTRRSTGSARGCAVSARAPDGTIEAIEDPSRALPDRRPVARRDARPPPVRGGALPPLRRGLPRRRRRVPAPPRRARSRERRGPPGRPLPAWATWAEPHELGAYTVGIEEEVMLLDQLSWALAHRIDSVLPAPPPRRARRASPPRPTARRWRSRPASTAGRRRRSRSWRRCAASSTTTLRPLSMRAAERRHPPVRGLAGDRRLRRRALPVRLRLDARAGPARADLRPPRPRRRAATPRRRSTPPTGCAPHIPLLLALSVNSPFWQGRDTGLASARTPLFQAFPRVGIPRAFADYAEYVETVDVLIRCDAVPEPTFLWWDVRPQPRFGTVEVRIMDAQTTLADTAALAALVQSIVRARGRGGRASTCEAAMPAGGAGREPLPRRPRRHGRRADRAASWAAGAGPRAARRPARRLPPPRRGARLRGRAGTVMPPGRATGAQRQLELRALGSPAARRRACSPTTSSPATERLAGGKHELADDQVRGQFGLAVADAVDPDLDHDGAAAGVEGVASATISSPGRPAPKTFSFSSIVVKSLARRDAAEGRPGGDGVAERGPDAAVDEAARVQVAAVDDDAAAGVRRPRSRAARFRGRRESCPRELADLLRLDLGDMARAASVPSRGTRRTTLSSQTARRASPRPARRRRTSSPGRPGGRRSPSRSAGCP